MRLILYLIFPIFTISKDFVFIACKIPYKDLFLSLSLENFVPNILTKSPYSCLSHLVLFPATVNPVLHQAVSTNQSTPTQTTSLSSSSPPISAHPKQTRPKSSILPSRIPAHFILTYSDPRATEKLQRIQNDWQLHSNNLMF
ncbi:hypothetical protein V8G54_035668 [Vigna mungo]|uniref:Uncharacterized protein n=1 Tax=Vigna mungo TaxID=3915 RepID=A0AAQ3MFQ2_VIGMU